MSELIGATCGWLDSRVAESLRARRVQGLGMKCALVVTTLVAGSAIACRHEPTTPTVVAFFGDFTLVRADDWAGKQSCDYILQMDQWICSWGRLTITTYSLAISVRGKVVHAGVVTGPVVFQDSVSFTAALRVLDGCTVSIDSTDLSPNGLGVLKGDTLRFTGRNTSGDTLSWIYSTMQVQRPAPCT